MTFKENSFNKTLLSIEKFIKLIIINKLIFKELIIKELKTKIVFLQNIKFHKNTKTMITALYYFL
jgi:hypothetical protein